MFLFALGLNFKAVKPMFLEPVLCDAILGNSEFTSDMDACGCFRAGGSHGESGSHPGLIVALAGSLHGIIGPGWAG